VAVLGRVDAVQYARRPELYESDGFHRMPVQEIDNSRSVTPGVYGYEAKALGLDEDGVPRFICPAPINSALACQLQDLAIKAHLAIGTEDVSRVDMRMDAEGNPRLLEINTLPGLTPEFSDLCVIANADGLSYKDLILEILYLGASRWKLFPARPVEIPALEEVEMARLPFTRE
jgi:D-alanine-D-alanine ligase